MADPTPSAARAAAYVRESTEEQGQGFSPDAQRQAIAKFATENGLTIVGEYCDFHSGWCKADGRPEFQRLMADAAERRFDVVLVFHTSRFARNQVEARRYKALLRERLGIRVVSVTQPMGDDPKDPSSFLAESRSWPSSHEPPSRSTSRWPSTAQTRCGAEGGSDGAPSRTLHT
jgi:DNA invertase Pin-like site-specific DNA recombinase